MKRAKRPVLIIDLCWKKSSLSFDEFVKPIANIVKGANPFVIKHFTELSGLDIEEADCIILCGTALQDNEFAGHVDSFGWLVETEKPVLGICAGMQVLGMAFGASREKARETGMVKVTVEIENPLLPFPEFEAYALHDYALTMVKRFQILATSGNCIQMIKHESKSIYGILFHPEVRNEDIIRNFLKL